MLFNGFNILSTLSRLIALIGLTGIVTLALVSIVDIIGREVFSVPVNGFSDILDLCVIFSAAACFPASMLARQHVSVTFVGAALPQPVGRILDVLGHLTALGVMVLITWQVSEHAISMIETGEVTWLLGLKVWPVWLVVSIIFCIASLAQCLVVIVLSGILFGRVPPQGFEAQHPDVDAGMGEGI